jgi:glycosyltransferase involved in cell wall biosynthesis
MKISFITTVFNEEETIETFLDSVFEQTKMPDEIIIVDGGSRDATVKKIKDVRLKNKENKVTFLVLTKKGNRAVGRNEAIRKATGDVIVCTDAGNIVDKEWVKNITKPFKDKKVDVVAGYYKAIAETTFQKCVVPYAFVMPDKVDPDIFLPATRSAAFTKEIWKKVGGFDERLTHNEDYAFAKSLQKIHAKIVFEKDAIVYWMPRTSLHSAYIMMLRFAYGDAQARIWRPKVIFLFARYVIGLFLLGFAIWVKSDVLLAVLLLLFILYLRWAIWKNYRYINELKAIYLLPLLQLTADWAVLKGTTLGLFGLKLKY